MVAYLRFLAAVALWSILVFVAWAVDGAGLDVMQRQAVLGLCASLAAGAVVSGAIFYRLWRCGRGFVAACLTTLGAIPCMLLFVSFAAIVMGKPAPTFQVLLGATVLGTIVHLVFLLKSLPALAVWLAGSVLVEAVARGGTKSDPPPVNL